MKSCSLLQPETVKNIEKIPNVLWSIFQAFQFLGRIRPNGRYSGANWGGLGGAVAPPRFPQIFFYLFHRFNVQYMYKHVKLYYISVHELLSIGGADTELLARQRKKKFLPRQKKFCPPKKFVNWRPWGVSGNFSLCINVNGCFHDIFNFNGCISVFRREK